MRMACETLAGSKAHMETASQQRSLPLRGPAVDVSIRESLLYKTATFATCSKDARPLHGGMSPGTGCAIQERQSARTMKKASTELATKSLPASHVMAWECASWHACMKPTTVSQLSMRDAAPAIWDHEHAPGLGNYQRLSFKSDFFAHTGIPVATDV